MISKLIYKISIAFSAIFLISNSPASGACRGDDSAALVAVNTGDSNLYRWVRGSSTSGGFTVAARVGTNWKGIELIASDSQNGDLFAIDNHGNMFLYRFNGTSYTGGSFIGLGSLQSPGRTFINTTQLIAAGSGVLYSVQANGELLWWRWSGTGWSAGSGTAIGSGWGIFSKVFSGGNGVLYGVRRDNGDLLWYRHQSPGLATATWLGPNKVGSGWGDFLQIAGGGGVIFATTKSGALLYYNHLGIETGAFSWSNDSGSGVGSGWLPYNRLTVSPTRCTPVPARFDRVDIPVYFVHGIDPGPLNPIYNVSSSTRPIPSVNCAQNWQKALDEFRKQGWTGALQTVGYFQNDIACSQTIERSDYTRAIGDLGASLAWHLYEGYSRFGRPVNLIGHSSGGLLVRAAINGVARRDGRYPPYLYVQNAVTLSSPHQGVSFPQECYAGAFFVGGNLQQCKDMLPSSPFLQWLIANPQSDMSTDWTVIGERNDTRVLWSSELGIQSGQPGYLGAGHLALYNSQLAHIDSLAHADMKDATGVNGYDVNYWNYHGKKLDPADFAVTAQQTGGVLGPNLITWPAINGFESGNTLGPVNWAFAAVQHWYLW